jgi:hypothetical protein
VPLTLHRVLFRPSRVTDNRQVFPFSALGTPGASLQFSIVLSQSSLQIDGVTIVRAVIRHKNITKEFALWREDIWDHLNYFYAKKI